MSQPDLTAIAKALKDAGVADEVITEHVMNKSLAFSRQVGSGSASDDMSLNSGETGDSIAAKEGKVTFFDESKERGASNWAKDDEGVEKSDEEDEMDGERKPPFQKNKKSTKSGLKKDDYEDDSQDEDGDGYGQEDDEENEQPQMQRSKTQKSYAATAVEHFQKGMTDAGLDSDEWFDISEPLKVLVKSTSTQHAAVMKSLDAVIARLAKSESARAQQAKTIRALGTEVESLKGAVVKSYNSLYDHVEKSLTAAGESLAKSHAAPAPATPPTAPTATGISVIVPGEEKVEKSQGQLDNGIALTGDVVVDKKNVRQIISKAARSATLNTNGTAGKRLRELNVVSTPEGIATVAAQIPAEWVSNR